MTKSYIKVGDQTVDASTITNNNNRTFRDAWQLEGAVITVDMVKARDIKREQLRMDRGPLMEALDADFMKALETGADTTAIVAEKQRLRDAPTDPAIEAAMTPEALEDINL